MTANTIDCYKLGEELKPLIRETARFIRSHYERVSKEDIQTKVEHSLVSFVDMEAEKMLVSGLTPMLEGAGFITEEETVITGRKDLTWIIDPLDGTTNFLYGIPYFSISVALVDRDNNILLGMVYDIMQDQLYSAISGKGAFLNDRPLTMEYTALNKSIIVTGFPHERTHIDIRQYLDLMAYWFEYGRAFRRLGSAALELCFVASSKIHLYYEAYLNIWDIAAGVLIVREAGGVVSDMSGKDQNLTNAQIIACHPDLHKEVFPAFFKHLKG